jgi:hypothetical protein
MPHDHIFGSLLAHEYVDVTLDLIVSDFPTSNRCERNVDKSRDVMRVTTRI